MHHACSSPLLVAGLDLTQLGGHRLRLVDTGEARGQEVSGGCSAHRAHNASWRASFSSTGEASSGGKTAGPFTRPKSLEAPRVLCQTVSRSTDLVTDTNTDRHETALTAGDASNHVSPRETRKYCPQDDYVSSLGRLAAEQAWKTPTGHWPPSHHPSVRSAQLSSSPGTDDLTPFPTRGPVAQPVDMDDQGLPRPRTPGLAMIFLFPPSLMNRPACGLSVHLHCRGHPREWGRLAGSGTPWKAGQQVQFVHPQWIWRSILCLAQVVSFSTGRPQ